MIKLREEITNFGEEMYVSTEIKEMIDKVFNERIQIEIDLVGAECDRKGIEGRWKASHLRNINYNKVREEMVNEILTNKEYRKSLEVKVIKRNHKMIITSSHNFTLTTYEYKEVEMSRFSLVR